MASGDTIAIFEPFSARPLASSYATLDTRGDRVVLDFDPSADESADFHGVFPAAYNGGDLRIRLIWLATNSASGNAVWQVAFERHQIGVTDLDSDSYGPTATTTSAAATSSGVTTVAEVFVPAANLSGAVSGEPYRIRITRNATDAGDTLTEDAEVAFAEISEA